jgi:hypothetical protein
LIFGLARRTLAGMLETILAIACGALFMAAYIAPAAWAVGDAHKRGKGGAIIAPLFWLFGPLSAIVWLVIRPSATLIQRSAENFTTADDALAAAARLDQLGEWDAATALYQKASEQWPENRDYIAQCINQIKHKQGLA